LVPREARALAGQYLAALLESVERRNGWRLPEQLRERTLDGVRHQTDARRSRYKRRLARLALDTLFKFHDYTS
jgi:hypothetical protein